ncbi:unnamed protein product [Paramecium octaurelia]|uniref:Uncharacterized protein n=1 Tax=Paramecium octaurelia TaxID=43137 RepID=A0A8S1SIT2_PAROT|nr:unnamed protein product [Paramecium octaurelia]
MSSTTDVLKIQITALTECYQDQSHKQVILDFSTFNEEAQLNYLKSVLHQPLIGQEKEYYETHKEKLEDLNNFEQQILEVFYNDLVMKDYSSAMILAKEQFFRKQILDDKKTPLEFFQTTQSILKRACVIKDEAPLQLAEELKKHGYQNKPSIQFVCLKLDYELGKQQNENLESICQKVRDCQLSNLAPIFDVQFKTENIQNLFADAQIAYSTINAALLDKEVQTEYMILCTNIVDLAIQYLGDVQLNGDNQYKSYSNKLNYFVLKILFNSIPPSYGGIFFTFDRGFVQSKKILHFLNNLNKFDIYIAWPLGVKLNARLFDEVVKSYSIVQRQQSATITINQILKLFQNCFAGKYKDEEEQEVLQPIKLGSTSSSSS